MTWTLTQKDSHKITKLNVKQWHDAGYKGKGIRILSGEDVNDHAKIGEVMTDIFAPEAEFRYFAFTNSGFIDFVKEYKPHLITVSLDLHMDKSFTDKIDFCYEQGIPIFFAGGNRAELLDEHDLSFYNKLISVGALNLIDNKIVRASYSNLGIDFSMFTFMSEAGTSFATPALAGMTALIMQKYGPLNHKQVVQYWKDNRLDTHTVGYDNETGEGLPVLPDVNKNYEFKGEDMIFEDTKNHWAKDNIDYITDLGIMNGYPEGIFKPDGGLTRAEMATILVNLINKGYIEI